MFSFKEKLKSVPLMRCFHNYSGMFVYQIKPSHASIIVSFSILHRKNTFSLQSTEAFSIPGDNTDEDACKFVQKTFAHYVHRKHRFYSFTTRATDTDLMDRCDFYPIKFRTTRIMFRTTVLSFVPLKCVKCVIVKGLKWHISIFSKSHDKKWEDITLNSNLATKSTLSFQGLLICGFSHSELQSSRHRYQLVVCSSDSARSGRPTFIPTPL